MKKLITILLLICTFSLITSLSYAATPKFRLHVLKNLAPGCNYSINTPVIIDYDLDGDPDVILITKEGVIYFLENLLR
jgi:hypothetical protein